MKKVYIRLTSILLSMLVLFTSVIPSYAYTDNLDLVADTAIAMEANTGLVLYSKNSNKKMYPASTTKVLTAHLVIKHINNLDKVVKVKEDLSWVEPSSMFLKVGESFTVRELLTVLMLKSANDVAVLLAKEVSGSVEEFTKLMNNEAKALGCMNSNFVNPNGLPDDNHYSTAYDMALIAREAIKNEELMEIVNTKSISLPANEFYTQERIYTNTNKFITGKGQMPYKDGLVDYKYDIVDGLKTGYTFSAGRCLLTSSKSGDNRIITGVFNSKQDNVYVDSRKLIDYSLENFKSTNIVDVKEIEAELEKKVIFSREKKVRGYLKEGYTVVEGVNPYARARALNGDEYTYKVQMKNIINPNIAKDEVLGTVSVYKNKEKVKTLDIYAKDGVHSILDLEQLILLIVGMCILIVIFYLKVKRNKNQKNNQRLSKNIYVKAKEKR